MCKSDLSKLYVYTIQSGPYAYGLINQMVQNTNGPRQANLVLIAYASAQSCQNLSCSPNTSSESRGTFRQKTRSLAPLNAWACAVKIYHDGMLEDTNSLDGAHIWNIPFMKIMQCRLFFKQNILHPYLYTNLNNQYDPARGLILFICKHIFHPSQCGTHIAVKNSCRHQADGWGSYVFEQGNVSQLERYQT